VQQLVYYISEVFHDAKIRYLEVHKLLYAVLIASRKVCHYLQAHRISVVTLYPLKVVLHNPNATRNIAKWAAELAEFELDFLPHYAVKSHVILTSWQTGHRCSATQGGGLIASQGSKLRSSLSLTGHSSLMTPCASRVPEQEGFS
jgi:hypothetical protein